MKQHGIGIGYQYSHDFAGADVEQQYLPDALAERRYYRPTDQGYEATIGQRMAGREEARASRRPGRTPSQPQPGPDVDGMRRGGKTRVREENRKKLAETEKRDAGRDGRPPLIGVSSARHDPALGEVASEAARNRPDSVHVLARTFGAGVRGRAPTTLPSCVRELLLDSSSSRAVLAAPYSTVLAN